MAPETNKSKQDTGHRLADYGELTHDLIEIAERSQELVNRFLTRKRAEGGFQVPDPEHVSNLFGELVQALLRDPKALVQAQLGFYRQMSDLWFNQMQRMMGADLPPLIEARPGDRRFKDDAWRDEFVFDYIKQSYLLTAEWVQRMIAETDGLDAHKREQIRFYARQYVEAMAPTNFALTNPQVIREAQASNGESLLRGLRNLLLDLEKGDGELLIKTTPDAAFKVGRDLATTPGKVIFQNDLMQLIQYAPSTAEVFERPLLIVPPWINKFYILDLKPRNSFIGWAVAQGFTVFVISWVNPEPEMAGKSFEDYMVEGPLAALDVIEQATAVEEHTIIGYCLGGTLTACLLAYMAAKGDRRIKAATFFTAMTDFEEAGELAVFIDDVQLDQLEDHMRQRGYLEARHMQRVFSMMRANDLIWSFVVHNYLLGREPMAFDLLHWNSDSTRMPAMMHSFYLRKMYQQNLLAMPGGLTMGDVPIDLGTIETPAYFLSTREDHIAPWRATYRGSRRFGRRVRFVLGGSGHIAGVINPASSSKYGYWLGDRDADDPEAWLDDAEHHEGSWWPDWAEWLGSQSGPRVAARIPGDGPLKPLENAPGSYVLKRSDTA